MKNIVIVYLFFELVVVVSVMGHSRLVCPSPQDPNSGIKVGPCGTNTGDFESGLLWNFSPGWNTIVLDESFGHQRSPFRIALSREGDDSYEDGILLDHIPHNDLPYPDFGNEETWTPYIFAVFIPNIRCQNCKLQMINPMTDKLIAYDLDSCYYDPNCTRCTPTQENPNCFSIYHSCARVNINGTIPRDEFTFIQPESWPYRDMPSGNPSIYYEEEFANWDNNETWTMQDVPAEYRIISGPCAAIALEMHGPVGN